MQPARQPNRSRILIVEDECFIADDARAVLSNSGAEVLGPVPTVAEARALIDAEPRPDAVLLDVNLGGEMTFDLADTLRSRGIPFAFMTGYDRLALGTWFPGAEILQKPVCAAQLVTFFRHITQPRQR